MNPPDPAAGLAALLHDPSSLASPALASLVLVLGWVAARLGGPLLALGIRLTAFAGFSLLLSFGTVSPFTPTADMAFSARYLVVGLVKLVWWLAGAWLLAGLVQAALVFKRQPRESRFLQDFCAGVIYVCALLGIVADVFGVPVRGLLAASGVIAIVLGLALQSTLGDVFSGVVLNLAKPYRPGDWVVLEGGLEGRVLETNWRATHLLTLSNDLAIVPNSIIAKAKVINESAPAGIHGITLSIRLDPAAAPLRSVALLETAMLGCTRILRAPHASVMVRSLDAAALECELTFFVSLVELGPAAQNEVFDRIYRHCAAAGLRLAPPAGSAMILPPRAPPPAPADIPRRLLDRLPIFLPLSDDDRRLLASKMRRQTYAAGDVLVEQDAANAMLFILATGVLAAFQRHEASDVEVLRYAPGDCFGQASVLGGAATLFKVQALTRATVYLLDEADLAPILKARPAVAAELEQIKTMRQAVGTDRLRKLDALERLEQRPGTRLRARMKALLGF